MVEKRVPGGISVNQQLTINNLAKPKPTHHPTI